MGDNPIQAQRAINYLNSQSKMQLQFVDIQDREYLIIQAKKYIVKKSLSKEVLMKVDFLKERVDQFKLAFKFLFDNVLPSFWNDEGLIVAEDDYLIMLNQKKSDTILIDKLNPFLKGSCIFDVLDKDLSLYFKTRRIISNMPPPSYTLFSDLDVVNRDILVVAFSSSSVW